MKLEEGILVFGAVLLCAIIVIALLPDSTFENNGSVAGFVNSPDNIVATPVGFAPNPYISPMLGVPVAKQGFQYAGPPGPNQSVPNQSAPINDFSQQMPAGKQTVVPFNKAKSRPYNGNVAQLIRRNSEFGWGQVHVWVTDDKGGMLEISLAPDWFLRQCGSLISSGSNVAGNYYQFDTRSPNALRYAKDVTVNGKRCRLRSDEGLALWTKQVPMVQ